MPNTPSDMTTPLLIIRIVFEYFGIDISLRTSKTRKAEKVKACQVSMYYINEFTVQSQEVIASYFGKGHCTFIHSVKTVHNMIDTDRRFREDISKIYNRIIARLGIDEYERYRNFETDNV